MEVAEALLILLLVAIIILVCWKAIPKCGKQENLAPRGEIEQQLQTNAGRSKHAQGQDGELELYGYDDYYKKRLYSKPEDLYEEERYQHYANDEVKPEDNGISDESKVKIDSLAGGGFDYASMIQDVVLTPRLRANHKKWTSEMEPWSARPMIVDTFEPANYIKRVGINSFSIQPVAQINPTQVPSHIEPSDLFAFNQRRI